MLLLAPAAALAAGAIALPALVLLYLLKLRRRPVRVSATMLWTAAAQDLQANVPLRWIRPTALFFLHLVILALLVTALGRPALRSGGVARERAILLLDCSASMSATDMPDRRSRLDAAKDRARELARELSRVGASAAVLAFAHDASALCSFTTARRAWLDAIDAAATTDQPANLAAALQLAEGLARPESGEESGASNAATIVLISDGGVGEIGDLVVRGARVRYEAIGPALAFHDNLGVVALAARRDFEDPGLVRLFARIANADQEEKGVPVTLSLDGRVQERRAITVPPATRVKADAASANATPAPNAVALGEAGVTFEFLSPRGGLAMVSLGRDDALRADNEAALVLAPPARPAILLAHGERAGKGDGAVALGLLRDTLGELRPRTLRVVGAESLAAIVASGEWRAFDLLVCDGVGGVDLPPIPCISFGPPPKIAGLIVPAEIGKPNPDARDLADEGQGVLLWDRASPILRQAPLDSLLVRRVEMVSVPTKLPEGVQVTELARGVSSPLMLLVEDRGVRRVVVPFALEDSNWTLQVSFPLFLANAVEFLTMRGESAAGRSFTTSDGAFLALDASPSAKSVRVVGPITIDADASRAKDGRLPLGVIPRAGVYVAEGLGTPTPIAVNLLSPSETSLERRDRVEIGTRSAEASAGDAPREIWPWFILAAAALLGVEWVVYALQMRA